MKVSVPAQTTQASQQAELMRAKSRRQLGYLASHTLIYGLLAIGVVLFILPFMWMISTSLKPSQEVFTSPPQFLPSQFVWQNYIDGWTVLPFNTFLVNSLIVTCANVVGNLLSCSVVAFGFARLRARGRDFLFVMVLTTLMIPREVTIVPTFVLFSQVGLVNSLWPLIIPAWFGYPFFIFLLRQFFMSIPHDLDDAARIDGASTWQIFTADHSAAFQARAGDCGDFRVHWQLEQPARPADLPAFAGSVHAGAGVELVPWPEFHRLQPADGRVDPDDYSDPGDLLRGPEVLRSWRCLDGYGRAVARVTR